MVAVFNHEMIPPRSYYPWCNSKAIDSPTKLDQMDPLAVFLKGICLQHRSGVLRKKLHVIDPSQFGRYYACDLLRVGLTELEINRLVSRLLDLDLPIGNLLSEPTAATTNSGTMWHSNWDISRPVEMDHFRLHHKPKLLRKLFGKKTIPSSSAPVSPSHHPHHYVPLSSASPTSGHRRRRTYHSPSSRRSSPTLDAQAMGSATPTAIQTPKVTTSPPPITCLIAEQDIQMHSRLGVGSFGIVRRADWTTPSGEVIPVAVKLLRPEAVTGDHFKAFLDELRAMQSLSHPNLIRLHGVVLSNPIMMVTELAPLGSLLLHLRAQSMCSGTKSSPSSSSGPTHLPQVPPALQVDALWDMGIQIAQGMTYLCSRGLVHRDLAARNILLAAVRPGEYPQIKIGDFGLVRAVTASIAAQTDSNCSPSDAVYTGQVEQRIPFAWSAPESIRKRIFSQASDVWSWGVTCWELWTSGAAPWPGMDAERLLFALDAGRRLAWPRSCCPRRLYQIMLACWRTEPHRRPTFAYLVDRLNKIRPFEVVATQTFDEADRLGLESGDVVVVIEGQPSSFWWRGQNRRTGEVGSFPRSIVRREGKLSPEDISRPIANTFIHAAHVDSSGRRWGNLDKPNLQGGPSDSEELSSTNYRVRRRPTGDSLRLFDDPDRLRSRDPDGSEESWYPIQDSSSVHSFALSRTSQAGEDAYSCFNSDSPSVLAPRKPSLEQYDDADDERAILDRTPNSMTGDSGLILKELQFGKRNVLCDLSYESSLEYQSSNILPPPPGPKEDDEDSSEYHLKRASSLSSLFSVFSAAKPSQPDMSFTEARHDSSDNVSPSESRVASAPPLIDLYSPSIPPRPQSDFRFPIPSVPVYPPRFPYYFPPQSSIRFGTPPPLFFRPPEAPPVTKHSGPDDDPFDLFKSQTQSTETLSSRLPDPPADPFDWDALRRSMPSSTGDGLESRSSTPVAMTQSTPDVGRSGYVRLERQLLVGSAAPPNPFSDHLSKHEPPSVTMHNPVTRPRPVAHKDSQTPILNNPVQSERNSDNTANRSSDLEPRSTTQSRIDMEVAHVRAQIPGCSVDEAQQALSYLTNPFFSISPYLHVPPFPSAPPYQPTIGSTSSPFLTQRTIERIQLAVRFLSVNRLYHLGLADWDTCCRILSAFRWSLTTAANWLIEHRPYNKLT